jgi:hypothetical protein
MHQSAAPLAPGSAEYLAPMLARVEGMPLPTLQAAVCVPWTRTSPRCASMGGISLSHLAERCTEKIAHLVYLCAVMLPAGGRWPIFRLNLAPR